MTAAADHLHQWSLPYHPEGLNFDYETEPFGLIVT
jgi:hypothetical protein